MSINYYSYQELRAAAASGKKEDINALGEWFDQYGAVYWNGEFYGADGIEIYPLDKYDAEAERFERVGYTTDRAERDALIEEAIAAGYEG